MENAAVGTSKTGALLRYSCQLFWNAFISQKKLCRQATQMKTKRDHLKNGCYKPFEGNLFSHVLLSSI